MVWPGQGDVLNYSALLSKGFCCYCFVNKDFLKMYQKIIILCGSICIETFISWYPNPIEYKFHVDLLSITCELSPHHSAPPRPPRVRNNNTLVICRKKSYIYTNILLNKKIIEKTLIWSTNTICLQCSSVRRWERRWWRYSFELVTSYLTHSGWGRFWRCRPQ